jgi:hypothetical protein
VDRHEDWWTLTAQLGSVQPKALTWSRDVFYIGARQTHAVDFEGQIFADNLPEPLPLRLSVQINTKNRKLDLREVERGV